MLYLATAIRVGGIGGVGVGRISLGDQQRSVVKGYMVMGSLVSGSRLVGFYITVGVLEFCPVFGLEHGFTYPGT